MILNHSINYVEKVSIDGIKVKKKLNFPSDVEFLDEASTIPYDFYDGSAVVYNNEIHILGSFKSYSSHYKWDGTEWTSVSTLPYSFYFSAAVVYDDKIHILGGYSSSDSMIYKWNGTEWILGKSVPYHLFGGSAVVHNNKIHMLGSNNNGWATAHYCGDIVYTEVA